MLYTEKLKEQIFEFSHFNYIYKTPKTWGVNAARIKMLLLKDH